MATCAICKDPLVLVLDDSEDEIDNQQAPAGKAPAQANTVPDDVELACRDHFHYQCLLESYESPHCPSCHADISSTANDGTSQICCNMHNEGGLQQGLDILPLLTEEHYLRAHPEERICRAFLELCREGDVAAIVGLLRSCDESDHDEEDGTSRKSAAEVLRYQDPIGEMQSGLHAAVSASQREVAWLLLLVASSLPELEVPALVYQEAAQLGVMRPDQTGQIDIRSLRDSYGRSAEQLADVVGGVWHGWPGTGRLTV